MTDPNLNEFNGRVARLQKAREDGFGFEAAGTLGPSFYHRPTAQRRSVLGPIVFLLLCTVLVKGTLYHLIGAQFYNERVSALNAGGGIERAGGWLMQVEPATILVADLISFGMGKLW